jgi:hypothetical protein
MRSHERERRNPTREAPQLLRGAAAAIGIMNLRTRSGCAVLMFSQLDFLIGLVAIAASVAVRPWRLLAFDSRYELLPPLLILGIMLPMLWWSSQQEMAVPVMRIMGAQLALLTLGWPLAVLLFAYVALGGMVGAEASLGSALSAFVWAGVMPATLGLAAGHLLRLFGRSHPMSYLLGRSFVVALLATFGAALLAQGLFDRYQSIGEGVIPALFLASLLDAMLTGACMTLLVALYPRCAATWSDRLYLGDKPLRPVKVRTNR